MEPILRQDPRCSRRFDALVEEFNQKLADQQQAFKDEVSALETAYKALLFDAEKNLRDQAQARFRVLDDDMSAMEQRLTSRLEEIEDAGTSEEEDSAHSISDGDKPVGGHRPWSVRKREAIARASDPSVFTKPYKPKHAKPATVAVPAEAAASKE